MKTGLVNLDTLFSNPQPKKKYFKSTNPKNKFSIFKVNLILTF